MPDHLFAAEAEIVKRALGLPAAMAADLAVFGGVLRCGTCWAEQPLGDMAAHLGHGWPRCCGLTMTWVTRKQLLAERWEVPDGYELAAAVSEGWRLEAGRRCSASRGRCGKPSMAALNRPRHYPARGPQAARTVDAWFGYCVDDLYGNWVESGQVMHWILREKQ